MRLLIYTAAIAVVFFALGYRVETFDTYSPTVAEHDAELGARIESLERRVRAQDCVHFVYEDGSAIHPDAEVAHRCLQTQLGWP